MSSTPTNLKRTLAHQNTQAKRRKSSPSTPIHSEIYVWGAWGTPNYEAASPNSSPIQGVEASSSASPSPSPWSLQHDLLLNHMGGAQPLQSDTFPHPQHQHEPHRVSGSCFAASQDWLDHDLLLEDPCPVMKFLLARDRPFSRTVRGQEWADVLVGEVDLLDGENVAKL